jgi:transposase
MTELNSDLALTVTRVGSNGKRRYDAQSKLRLIEACLQPGVSVAGLALKAGVNANQLRQWIKLYQERGGLKHVSPDMRVVPTPAAPSAFVPVVEVGHHDALEPKPVSAPAPSTPRMPARSHLIVEMPNGITLRLDCTAQDAPLMSAMIESLGRCHVPARR